MSLLLYIVGLIIGVSIFLYFLYALQGGKRKFSNKAGIVKRKSSGSFQETSSEDINYKNLLIQPGERMCPLCRSKLTKSDALYATQAGKGTEKKIYVHGCKYCYKPEDEDDSSSKSV